MRGICLWLRRGSLITTMRILLHNAFWALADEGDEDDGLEVGRDGKGWEGMKRMEWDRFETDQGVGMRSIMGVGMRKTMNYHRVWFISTSACSDQIISSSAHKQQ